MIKQAQEDANVKLLKECCVSAIFFIKLELLKDREKS